MQNITISGNLGKDAELRTVRDSQVLSFNVGVKNGFGSDAGSVWYRCSPLGQGS
jgi:single-stranded DNA-binding protein